MKYNPLEDGVTHLNVYSKAKTEIGRLISNFAYCPIETQDGHFDSVEGYWGWLSISEENPKRETLRTLSGFAAKQFKDDLLKEGDAGRVDMEFEKKIENAIHLKFQTKMMQDALEKNQELLSLPICHYYYYKSEEESPKIVDVTETYPEFIGPVRKEIADFLSKKASLFGITKGIICQQVNCQAVMGAGLAKTIMDKYPIVYKDYMKSFQKKSKEEMFGKIRMVEVASSLYVANIYSQFYYGNPAKTGKIYTDAEKLVRAVEAICNKYSDLPVYLPHTKGLEGKKEYGIGCGYGGETWEKLSKMFRGLNKKNLHLLDTVGGIVHELDGKIFGQHIVDSYEHAEMKYPFCAGISQVGKTMLQYQADIAKKYKYQPLPDKEKEQSLILYGENLPEEFSGNRRDVKGGFEIEGKDQPLYLKNGEKIAEKYNRIVVGNYGAFLEIDKEDMVTKKLTTKKGEEYRETGDYNVKYHWKTVGDTGVKIYEQIQGVSYADYKPEKYYISPYEVMGKEEILQMGKSWNDKFSGFFVEKSATQKSILCDASKYEGRAVVFDMETTGLSADKGDEPLQISITNENGEVILSTYLKPYHKTQWKDAQKVNHISPLMVSNAPHLDEYSDGLQEIFSKASVVVGHNVAFDLKFLEKYGKIKVDRGKVFDTCRYFKKDEPSLKHTLADAINYYCPEAMKDYEKNAHNALYDTIATARVYSAIVEKEKDLEK